MLGRTLSPIRCFAIMLIAILICYAGVISLPYSADIRYQSFKGTIYSRLGWIYDRIYHDPTPIDVVFLGSSRTEVSMRPSLLQPALERRGLDLNVVNFAIASTGYDIRETLAEEVLPNKAVRLLVIDLSETLPRDGHQAFGDLATVQQILDSPWLVNRNLPRNLLRLPVRQIDLAMATLAPEANGYRAKFDPAHYAGPVLDPPPSLPLTKDLGQLGLPSHESMLEAQSRLRYSRVTPPILPRPLESVEFGVSRSYIERIVRLARQRNVKVAFLFIPYYKGPTGPREEVWLRQFGPVWKADFIRLDPNNYRDSGHASANSRTQSELTEWMSSNITQFLSKR